MTVEEACERIDAIAAENAALRLRCNGLVCFSCGDEWSVEKDREKCDQAHRENWTHEWVSPRVVLLTKEIVALHQRAEAAERKLAASAVVDDMIHASDGSEYRALRQRAEAEAKENDELAESCRIWRQRAEAAEKDLARFSYTDEISHSVCSCGHQGKYHKWMGIQMGACTQCECKGVVAEASGSCCAGKSGSDSVVVFKSRFDHLVESLTKLSAFKQWVHAYLDDLGIPTHPDGPHSKEGCRIGDRMDLLVAQRDVTQKELDAANLLIHHVADAPLKLQIRDQELASVVKERDAALASKAVMRKALEECQNDPRVEYRTRHMVDAALASDTGKT